MYVSVRARHPEWVGSGWPGKDADTKQGLPIEGVFEDEKLVIGNLGQRGKSSWRLTTPTRSVV